MPGLVGTTLDSYRLVDQIGQGGMSTVYRAVDTRTQQEVAVKALSPTISSDKRFVRRFRREAGLLFRLRHPNIVPVTDYGEAKGVVYLVMPLVLGDTLHDRLTQQKLSVPDLSRWIGQVSDALQFAHDQGVIHRDIKPANVMISRTGNALLTDFGLARLVEGSHSLTGSMLMGTPAYVSPEQGRGQMLDARSDQYALGVILYQIAAGRLPFEGDIADGHGLDAHSGTAAPAAAVQQGRLSGARTRDRQGHGQRPGGALSECGGAQRRLPDGADGRRGGRRSGDAGHPRAAP